MLSPDSPDFNIDNCWNTFHRKIMEVEDKFIPTSKPEYDIKVRAFPIAHRQKDSGNNKMQTCTCKKSQPLKGNIMGIFMCRFHTLIAQNKVRNNLFKINAKLVSFLHEKS